MASPFRVIDHTIHGQHIREYPTALRGKQEDAVQIAIKQYIPVNRPDPVPENAVTIIGLHGNGFPKEIYEPYMVSLCEQLESKRVIVRGIWMVDSYHQGASGLLNEEILGDNPNWYDHSRDLLQMVNTFREEMPRPIIGIAHSFGCAQMVQLSILHPRLLSTIILCEPVMVSSASHGPNPGFLSSIRRDFWPSRAEAEAKLRKAFKTWHPAVLDLYLKHGLRPTPTPIYDTDAKGNPLPEDAVTLTTTKHQETWTFAQLNVEEVNDEMDRLLRPDLYQGENMKYVSSRPEAWSVMQSLPFVRPSTLYVFGAKSPLSPPKEIEVKTNITGTGIGGSGGAKKGRVKKVVFPKGGHLIPFEQGYVDEYAKVSSEWIGEWFIGWLEDEQKISEYRSRASDETGRRMSREYLAAMKADLMTERPFKMKEKAKEKL